MTSQGSIDSLAFLRTRVGKRARGEKRAGRVIGHRESVAVDLSPSHAGERLEIE
jgi:hypothetical protein